MTEEKLKQALKLIILKLKGIDFVLLGTADLKIQGMDFDPNDLDFLTDDIGIEKVSKLFKSKITKNNNYLETKFILNNTEIHFVSVESNNVRPDNFTDYIINIDKYGLKIPCMNLQSELEAYVKMKRDKDKEKIVALELFLGSQ